MEPDRLPLIVGQLNLRVSTGTRDLIQLARTRGYHILAISEPPVNFASMEFFDSIVICSSKPSAALVFLRLDLNPTEIKIDSHVVSAYIPSLNLRIHSVYVPCTMSRTPHEPTMNKVESVLLYRGYSRTERVLLLGDLNARSSMVGFNNSQNSRGIALNKLVIDNEWLVLNDRKEHTFCSLDRTRAAALSTPDWSIASSNIADDCRWSIDSEFPETDHRMINIEVLLDECVEPPQRMTVFVGSFVKRMSELVSDGSIVNWQEKFKTAIDFARGKVKPKERVQVWNDELTKQRKDMLILLNDIRNRRLSRSSNEWLDYRNMANDFKMNLRNARRDAFESFLDTLTEQNAFRTIWQWIRNGSKAGITSITVNGTIECDQFSIARNFVQFIYPSTPHPSSFMHLNSSTDPDPPLAVHEVATAIFDYGGANTAGADGVSMVHLKLLYNVAPDFINNLMTHCYSECLFPAEWKTCKIIMLPKKPMRHPTCNLIRPIGLIDCIGKILELIINNRIRSYAMANPGTIDPRQFGFVHDRSTDDALANIQRIRMHNESMGRREVLLSLDIEGAFNNIEHDAIIRAMVNKSIPSNLVNIIKSYLSDRVVTVNNIHAHFSSSQPRGVVQGSVLGPLLWILAIDDIIGKIAEYTPPFGSTIEPTVFADDFTLVVSHSTDLEKAIRDAGHALVEMKRLLSPLGLKLSAPKTQLTVTDDTVVDTRIRVDGVPIENIAHSKILGVYFSYDRTFIHHMQQRINKMEPFLMRFSMVCRRRFGLKHDVKLSIVNKAILPMLSYACRIWFDPNNTRINCMLRFAQKKLTAHAIGSYQTISYVASIALTGFHPFPLFIRKTASTLR